MSDFFNNLRSQGLCPTTNIDEKLVDLRRKEEEFELYMVRTRERFAAERVNLLRDQSEAERLRVCMGELAKTVKATPVESEVKPTKNSAESEVKPAKNSVVEIEVDETENSALEGEVESTKNSGESEAGDPKTLRLKVSASNQSRPLV